MAQLSLIHSTVSHKQDITIQTQDYNLQVLDYKDQVSWHPLIEPFVSQVLVLCVRARLELGSDLQEPKSGSWVELQDPLVKGFQDQASQDYKLRDSFKGEECLGELCQQEVEQAALQHLELATRTGWKIATDPSLAQVNKAPILEMNHQTTFCLTNVKLKQWDLKIPFPLKILSSAVILKECNHIKFSLWGLTLIDLEISSEC